MSEKMPAESQDSKNEFLRNAVKFQDGRSADEQFIGYHGADGEYGVFIDKDGIVLDGTDTFGKIEDNANRTVVRERVLEIYKEKFSDGDLSAIEQEMTLEEE